MKFNKVSQPLNVLDFNKYFLIRKYYFRLKTSSIKVQEIEYENFFSFSNNSFST